MKIIFFGTPDYVLPILTALNKVYEVVCVVTQSPKEVGRKKFITRSPIDNWAYKHKVEVIYDLNKIPKADLGILAAYGKIIPEFVIGQMKFGILNVHPSLLPKWRGASPVQAAISSGETETGVSIIKTDEEVDHGPLVSQFKEDILPEDTTGTLRARLFQRSADVLVALIKPYIEGKIKPRLQNHKEATFTHLIKKQDGFIPPEYFKATLQGASFKGKFMERFIRAMQPWPGAWTYIALGNRQKAIGNRKRLKILKAHIEKLMPNAYQLVSDLVQLEGKNPVSWKEFTLGYPNAEFA